MPFPADIAERLLVACHRHCCICHKPTGVKMEIHHIRRKAAGGSDNEENGIPLCFDCHAEVAAYNLQHPKGRRFTESELRRHKQQWFQICEQPPWGSRPPAADQFRDALPQAAELFDRLRVDDHRPAMAAVASVMRQPRDKRIAFLRSVLNGLEGGDEDTRWKCTHVIEELVLWDPRILPEGLLERMAADSFFSVRSSAAVCFYHLARLDPVSIPLDVLLRLATPEEDWYVQTPATSALLRLARTRPVIVDLWVQQLSSSSQAAREQAASALARLAEVDWELVPDHVISVMTSSADRTLRLFGQKCMERLSEAKQQSRRRDYPAF